VTLQYDVDSSFAAADEDVERARHKYSKM